MIVTVADLVDEAAYACASSCQGHLCGDTPWSLTTRPPVTRGGPMSVKTRWSLDSEKRQLAVPPSSTQIGRISTSLILDYKFDSVGIGESSWGEGWSTSDERNLAAR